MKKILFILLSLTIIWADNLKYKLELTPNMSTNKIIQTLNHIRNNTVIVFRNGKYYFDGSKLYIYNKNNIVITSDNNAIIKKLNLYITNSRNIEIKNISLNHSPILIDNSKIYIKNITSNSFIELKNSICKIQNSNLKSAFFKIPLSPITAYNSNIELSNNNITTFSYIYIKNSNLLAQNNIFTNNTYRFKQKKFWNSFLSLIHSQAIIKNNQFSNNDFAIGEYNNSNAIIKNNDFENLHYGISIDNSQTIINNNSFQNFINDEYNTEYPIGIYTKNSKSNILNNKFDSLFIGIQITSKSLSNINNNFLINFYNIKKRKNQHCGIFNESVCMVNDIANSLNNLIMQPEIIEIINSKSNILNNKYSCNVANKYLAYADKKSQVFNKDNTNNIFNKGISLSSPININIDKIKPFEYKFSDIKEISYDLNKLKIYSKDSFYKKGYLTKPYLLTLNYNGQKFQKEFPKGTYMEIDTDKKIIIKPSKFKGTKVSTIPNLIIDAMHRDINIKPILKVLPFGKSISFEIKSNIKLKNVILDNKSLQFQNNNDIYVTIPRLVDLQNHILIIKGEKFEDSYDCIIDTEIKCIKKTLPKL